jgi:hypothetical protein
MKPYRVPAVGLTAIEEEGFFRRSRGGNGR